MTKLFHSGHDPTACTMAIVSADISATACSSQRPSLEQHRSSTGTFDEHWVREHPSCWAHSRHAWGWTRRACNNW